MFEFLKILGLLHLGQKQKRGGGLPCYVLEYRGGIASRAVGSPDTCRESRGLGFCISERFIYLAIAFVCSP